MVATPVTVSEPTLAPSAGSVARKRLWLCLVGTALVVAVGLVFGQTTEFDFVDFDDDRYVTGNTFLRQGLSREGVSWALTAAGPPLLTYWQPTTWLSLLLDYELYGMDAGGYHRTNVWLHAANALLLLAVLHASTGAVFRSALVAGLFALHPLHVEPVAWITERKELLSTGFGLLATLCWIGWVRRKRRAYYGLCAVCLAVGLAAKSMIVTLPVLLLLLDRWPLERRESFARLFLEKLPLLAISAASAAVTTLVQARGAAQHPPTAEVGFAARAINALVSYARYPLKAVVPTDLTPFYPHPNIPELGGVPWGAGEVAAAALALVGVSLAVAWSRRAYAVVGWLWYLVSISPVVGWLQFAPQAMADRYAYLPLIGPFFAVVWGVAEAVGRLARSSRAAVPVAVVGSGLVLALLGSAAHRQAGTWRDSLTLFAHAVAVHPDSSLMHANLGAALLGRDLDAAVAHLERALEIHPDYAEAHANLGVARERQGDRAGAVQQLERALALRPQLDTVHFNLGNLLVQEGRLEQALPHLREAVRLRPDVAASQRNLGHLLRLLGQSEEAALHYREALRLAPDDVGARTGLADLEADGV